LRTKVSPPMMMRAGRAWRRRSRPPVPTKDIVAGLLQKIRRRLIMMPILDSYPTKSTESGDLVRYFPRLSRLSIRCVERRSRQPFRCNSPDFSAASSSSSAVLTTRLLSAYALALFALVLLLGGVSLQLGLDVL